MKLINANVVLLGGFNPHIIQPHWLVQHEVAAGEPEEPAISVQINIGGGAQPIRFSLGSFDWEVGLTRLKISSDEGRAPSDMIRKLLGLLPHTPIRAVGHNFQLRDDERKWEQSVARLPNYDLFQSKLGEQTSSAIVSRSKPDEDVEVRITFTISESKAMIDANYHRAVDGMQGALHAIERFESDQKHIRDIAKEICRMEPSNE